MGAAATGGVLRTDQLPELFRRIGAWTDTNPLMVPIAVGIRWPVIFYRQLRRDRAFIRAAGMAYITLIAIVPLLVLVFAVLSATGMLAGNPEAIYNLLFGPLFGELPQVRDYLLPGLLKVDLRALSLTGTAGLLIIAARLYLMVEKAYNDIFGVAIKRGFGHRILNFYFTLTAVPIVLALTVMGSANIAAGWGLGWAQSWITSSLNFLLILMALKLFPCTTVKWRPAVTGALVTWLLMLVGARGFSWYIKWFASDDPLRAIYGALGVLPIFLLWLYLLWIFVLLGVEVAHTVQNYDSLVAAELEQLELDRQPWRRPSVDLALEVATWVAWHYETGRGPIRLERLSERCGLPLRDVTLVTDVLVHTGVLVHTDSGFGLARSPATLTLAELVRDWREVTTVGPTAIAGVSAEVDAALLAALGGTLQDAVLRWVPDPDRPITEIVTLARPG